jgi:hypothetical protein
VPDAEVRRRDVPSAALGFLWGRGPGAASWSGRVNLCPACDAGRERRDRFDRAFHFWLSAACLAFLLGALLLSLLSHGGP